jgi:hypothetical protein
VTFLCKVLTFRIVDSSRTCLRLDVILEICQSLLQIFLFFLVTIQIVYEDADEEELDWKELERILVPVTDSLPAASKKRPPINVTAGKENRWVYLHPDTAYVMDSAFIQVHEVFMILDCCKLGIFCCLHFPSTLDA